jgi:hypothetical protein
MIEATQNMIGEQNNNSDVHKHFGLQIRTLQNAPRTVLNNRLQALLRLREREKEGTADMEDTQRLVTERLKMVQVVLNLLSEKINRIAIVSKAMKI